MQVLVPGVSIGLEEDFDVAHGIDESIKPLILVSAEARAREDQHPTRVPHRTPDQTGVHRGFCGFEFPAISVSAELRELANAANLFAKAANLGNPIGT